MENVLLGTSGLSVSRLCYGTLTVGPLQAKLPLDEGADLLACAIGRGINFFDTAQLYGTYPYLREAMRRSGRRNIVISSKTYAYTAGLAEEAVEEARRGLDRDTVDIFMLHEQESTHTLRGHREALERLLRYKQDGVIRAVGASMHHVAAVYGAIEYGLDVIHPILNVAGLGIADGSRGQMEEAVRQAHGTGIGVFAMKPLGGGNLFRRSADCLDYITGLSYVDAVAVGMQSRDEIGANLDYFEKGAFSPGALAALESKRRRLHIDDWCQGCGACEKRCGQDAIHIVGGMAVCDAAKCILCGYCAPVCPMWAIKVV